jgi:hypothetical protein
MTVTEYGGKAQDALLGEKPVWSDGQGCRKASARTISDSMGQGLWLASISEARANACVSIYSRMFVSFPFRTVMAKTQWSSNDLFVATTLPFANPFLKKPRRFRLRVWWSRDWLASHGTTPCLDLRHASSDGEFYAGDV